MLESGDRDSDTENNRPKRRNRREQGMNVERVYTCEGEGYSEATRAAERDHLVVERNE